ncbi:hypothetical protein AQUCO_04600033v1 [Aquilegia coerulea]|uniref:DUF4283 domain-containing protein n=1 Tax=Aquilegia coerulea TaxID=218851 RepID=A0A2G5CL98_AQUCA|nr:hypothetical protein AQUCO_04600033v1 [Aquilegia coerulea]
MERVNGERAVFYPWEFLDGVSTNVGDACRKVGTVGNLKAVESMTQPNNGVTTISSSSSQTQSAEGDITKTFAQVMGRKSSEEIRDSFIEKIQDDQPQLINVADLPSPSLKGNLSCIKLPQKTLERGRLFCKFCLVGRLDFLKISLEKVRKIPAEIWNPAGGWKIIPLGKGFFMFRLSSEEELVRIWTRGPWKFENQALRLTRWTPKFDTDVQRSSKALVWVKFPKLGQQYWDYEILMSLGKALGDPIGVDKHTIDRDFGYFTSVLVEVDLSKSIPSEIVIEVENGKEFRQAKEVPKLPKFCSHCKALGHSLHECKGLHKAINNKEDNNNKVNNGFVVARKRNRGNNRGAETTTSVVKDKNQVTADQSQTSNAVVVEKSKDQTGPSPKANGEIDPGIGI